MSTRLHEEISSEEARGSALWHPRREQAVAGVLLLILLLVALTAAIGSPVWLLLSTAAIVLALAITTLLAISMLAFGAVIRAFRHEQAQSTAWLK